MQNYENIEECILSCLIMQPNLFDITFIEEKHFRKYGYVFTFFKEFYSIYHNLDINIMLSSVKSKSIVNLEMALETIIDVFALPTHYKEYQKKLYDFYKIGKKDEWLSKKIYNLATQLVIGKITIEKFNKECINVQEYANKMEWK